ncbi:MAG: hypothetical protein DRP45_08490, partial [Candidatus Zixiibacteriota bacterium]
MANQSVQLSNANNGMTLEGQNRDGLDLRMQIGSVNLSTVTTKDGDFTMMSAVGMSRHYDAGEPAVILSRKLIVIPQGCELRAEVIRSTSEEMSLTDLGHKELLIPAQRSLSKSEDPMSVPFEFNRSLYSEAGFYSRPLVEVEILGTMRGIRIGAVTISPVEYNAQTNSVRIHHDVEVEVRFENADWAKTDQLMAATYSPFFQPVYKQIINYEDPAPSARDALVTYPIKYLIISDPMFETQLQPFIEWKIKKGFNVVCTYTDEIGSGLNTEIKTYIKNMYNHDITVGDPPPSFVLLVGDHQQIESFDPSVSGPTVTDLEFCEFTHDDLPEIFYGRFSAQTTAELQPQIDKTLEYEQYLMPDPSYLGEVTLVSGVDGSYADLHGNGQIEYGTENYFNLAHGIDPHVWLYPASAAGSAADDIIETINDGVGLYNYTAHCSPAGHGSPSFTTGDLPGLTNYNMYLLGIGNCCSPNEFNTGTCFGEAFLRLEDKGGIGYIGSTASTYWDEDYWWGVG